MRSVQWGDHFGAPCTQPQLARAACRADPRSSCTSRPTPLIRLLKGGDAKTLPPWRLATRSLRQWATTSTLAGLAPPSLPSLASSRRALPSLSQDAPPAPFLRSRRALDDPDDLDEQPGRPRHPQRAETALDSRAGDLDARALLSIRVRAGDLKARARGCGRASEVTSTSMTSTPWTTPTTLTTSTRACGRDERAGVQRPRRATSKHERAMPDLNDPDSTPSSCLRSTTPSKRETRAGKTSDVSSTASMTLTTSKSELDDFCRALGILRLCARPAIRGAAEETQSRQLQASSRSLRSPRASMTAAAAHLRVMPSPLTTYALLRSSRAPGACSTNLTSTHSLPPLCYVTTADASFDANGCT